MSFRFQELDNQQTPLGELSLRVRRPVSVPDADVYEVSLNGEFLMSSLINASERALATFALDLLGDRRADVLIGGLGLGYTAATALEYDTVRSVRIVEFLSPVIQWHRRRLVPAAAALLADPRCEIVHGDFFDHVRDDPPPGSSGRYDAVLLDIDHSPESLLNPDHARFYSGDSLRRMAGRLRPAGVFALWSAVPAAEAFLDRLRPVFAHVETRRVTFYNPLHHREDTNTIVLARKGGGDLTPPAED